MRSLLLLALLFGTVMNGKADTFVYVSMPPEQKIQIYRLDASSGKLASVAAVDVAGGPGSLGVDPQRKFLYASLRSSNSLASFRIDGATGNLQPINSAELPKGENAAFVSTDRTGRWLISASYSAGKTVVHRLAADGSIESPSVQTVETAKTAHCVAFDRANQWVFVPHVAPNAVYQFKFDATTGKLADAGHAPGGADKAGPRHLAFHPTQNLAFTSDESGSSITAYQVGSDGLKPLQTLSTLPADYTEKNSTAEVKVHPSGKFVWVSNRGHDSLAGFTIDASGKLTAKGHAQTEKTPRSFDIDPSGQFAFSAGEGSGKLAVFKIDVDNGKMTRIETLDVGKSLSWVLAVDVPGK